MSARKSDVRKGTRVHIFMCSVFLLAALISFLPVSMTMASALPSGCSEFESSVTSNTTVTCPSEPMNVSVQATDNGIDVKWDSVSVSNATAQKQELDSNAPTSFEVRVNPGDVVVNVPATSHTASVTGLVNGKEYEVSIVARNGFGASTIVGPLRATPTSGIDEGVVQLIVKYKDDVSPAQSD